MTYFVLRGMLNLNQFGLSDAGFYWPDAHLVTQSIASKHWRELTVRAKAAVDQLLMLMKLRLRMLSSHCSSSTETGLPHKYACLSIWMENVLLKSSFENIAV